MKKAIITAAAVLSTAATASAATFSFGTLSQQPETKKGYVAAYDKNGVLCGAAKTEFSYEDGVVISGELDFGSAEVESVRLFIPESDTVLSGSEIINPTPTPAPTEGLGSIPKIYQTEANAYTAPAMVKKVSSSYEDDELVYKTTLLFWGEEREFTFDSNLLIKQASDEYSDFIDGNASLLKPGDVIVLGYAFKNSPPKDICFLYRPSSHDPVTVTDDFIPLYTTEGLACGKWQTGVKGDIGYTFGIVSKVSSRYFTLTQADGTAAGSVDIPITSDAIVYGYNLTDSKSAEILGTGGIYESEISDECKDSDGNITSWELDSSRCYALVRTIDGTAADVMFYYD